MSSSNTTIKNFQGASQDGVVTLIGHISGGAYNSSAGLISPISFQFDVILDGTLFPWQLNNSMLALVVSVLSDSESAMFTLNHTGNDLSKLGGSTASTILIGEAVQPLGFFTWSPTLNVTVQQPANNESNCTNSTTPGQPGTLEGNNCTNQTTGSQSGIQSAKVIVSPVQRLSDNDADDIGVFGTLSSRLTFAFDVVQPNKIQWEPILGLGSSSSGPTTNSSTPS